MIKNKDDEIIDGWELHSNKKEHTDLNNYFLILDGNLLKDFTLIKK